MTKYSNMRQVAWLASTALCLLLIDGILLGVLAVANG